MSKRDKLLEQWRQQPRPHARIDEIEAVLKRYFGDGFTQAKSGGSHQYRVSHPLLTEHPHFLGGKYSIPVKNGQSIKPFYLKRIVEAIDFIAPAREAVEDEENLSENIQESENDNAPE